MRPPDSYLAKPTMSDAEVRSNEGTESLASILGDHRLAAPSPLGMAMNANVVAEESHRAGHRSDARLCVRELHVQ